MDEKVHKITFFHGTSEQLMSPMPLPFPMSPPPETDTEWIEETTVGSIGIWSIGVANIWERRYDLPEGATKEGLSASISLWAESLIGWIQGR